MLARTQHNVATIPGDLNGKTVTAATLSLYPFFEPALTLPIVHTERNYNVDYYLKEGITALREDVELAELAQFDQIFLGAIGDPTKMKPGIIEAGTLLTVRQKFDQYACLRPVVLPEGVPTRLVDKDHRHINFEIVRENTEGLYCRIGRIENEGTDDEVGVQEMRCSYKGVKRLAEFALQRARARKRFERPRLTFVFKKNVLKIAASPWNRVEKETREENPDVDVRYGHVDIETANLVAAPEEFDVIITENMFGDIMSDVGAIIQGGMGTATSGNINPTGELPSMFEPVHGSAPDKWYEQTSPGSKEYIPGTFRPDLVQRIRPEAAFRSYAMMLDQMGERKAAALVRDAALANIRDPAYQNMSLDVLTQLAQKHIKKAVVA